VGLGLGCRRGSVNVFQKLNFSLRPGQLVWLRGANGCGKTSLLRIAAGLAEADEGTLTWHGAPVAGNAHYVRELTYLGHAHGLKDDLTAHEALTFLLQLQGLDSSTAAVDAALQRMAVQSCAHRAVRALSQGQRKRVALARLAQAVRPGMWLLDEPYDALDPAGIALVNSLLQGNLLQGGSVLVASHIAVGAGMGWGAGMVKEIHLERTVP
jgi:heme exporter protein A